MTKNPKTTPANKKGLSKWFWISIIILVITAIVVFILFTYFQIILDAIMGMIEGIIDFFANLF